MKNKETKNQHPNLTRDWDKYPAKPGDYTGGLPLPLKKSPMERRAQLELANERFKMGKYSNRPVDNKNLFKEFPSRPESLNKIPDSGRNEHFVWLEPDGFEGKVVRISKTKSTTLLNPTPEGYLQRWKWMNEVFGFNCFHHSTTDEGEVIIVQDFIEGDHPTTEGLNEDLKELGWQQIGTTRWLTPDSLWIIEDVDQTNFIKQQNKLIIPIDVDITPSTKQLKDSAEELDLFQF